MRSVTCSVADCVRRREARGWCATHYMRWRRHGDVSVLKRFSAPIPLAYRIRARSDRSGGPDACWLWRGARHKKGYGRLRWDGRTRLVTHLVYELDRGYPPEHPCVLHTCDNPPCVNPRHLWSGTNLDNVRDKERKGRGGQLKGEAHPHAKLTASQVREIQKSYAEGGTTQQRLGEKHGVCQAHISKLVLQKVWA